MPRQAAAPSGLCSAPLHDELGQAPERNAGLQKISDKNPFKTLAQFLLSHIAKGDKAVPDSASVDKFLKEMPDSERGPGCYFIGRFLELRGEKKKAKELYRSCVQQY